MILPSDLNNPENIGKVYQIIKQVDSDINLSDELIENVCMQLRSIGEGGIADKIENYEIIFTDI